MRQVTHTYQDPMDVIWIHAAAAMGMRVERASDVFASWDGQGTLRIGTQDTLDPDDSLAQMILHETCHALVEGPDAFHKADWGLDITDGSQRVHEEACLRLQAALTQPYGLRDFFAATTNFRKYYDALPESPLTDTTNPAVALALPGFERAMTGPWSEPLAAALSATAEIAGVLKPFVTNGDLWSEVQDAS